MYGITYRKLLEAYLYTLQIDTGSATSQRQIWPNSYFNNTPKVVNIVLKYLVVVL